MFFESIRNFFKGIFSAGATINNLFAYLASHLIYLLAGAIVAFIIILIIMLVMKKIPNWIICTLIAIACIGTSFGIAIIIENNMPINDPDALTIKEDIEDISNGINNNNPLTNGGFTMGQIKTVQNDDDAPLSDDVVIELNVKDFDNYVCYYYGNEEIGYQNAVFLKYDNGLIYDGKLNNSCDMNTEPIWFTLAILQNYDLNSLYWITEYEKEPYYSVKNKGFLVGQYDNLVTNSRLNDFKFARMLFDLRFINRESAKDVIRTNAKTLIINNMSYFTTFGEIEPIKTSTTSEISINSFYSYLWSQIKTATNNETKLIDVSHLMCKPIPTTLQTTYPISETAKAQNEDYADKDFYGVYKCNIAIKLTYTSANNISLSNQYQKFIDGIKEDEETTGQKKFNSIENGETLSDISISFVNRNDSELTDLDLSENPITIVFESTELNKTKKLVISDKIALEKANHILLNSNTTWKYEIFSPVVIFEGYTGQFSTTQNSGSLKFNIQYYDGKIALNVGLHLIGTLDLEKLDLATNPTKVILSNATKTYQFVFDNNDLIDQYITQIVEPGEYEYRILSTELIFASETGTLNITTKNATQLFNYSQNQNNTNINQYKSNFQETTSNLNEVKIYIKKMEIDVNDFFATLLIFNENGEGISSRDVKGTLEDDFYIKDEIINQLVEGEKYYFKFSFAYNHVVTTSISEITWHKGLLELYYEIQI